MDTARARVLVSGRVQGVFFRESTRRMAAGLSLAGSVRNLPDGTVEAEFQGDREAVERAVEWCRAGPPAARVDGVALEWLPPASAMTGFVVS